MRDLLMHIQLADNRSDCICVSSTRSQGCICNAPSHLNARQCSWIVVQNDTVISLSPSVPLQEPLSLGNQTPPTSTPPPPCIPFIIPSETDSRSRIHRQPPASVEIVLRHISFVIRSSNQYESGVVPPSCMVFFANAPVTICCCLCCEQMIRSLP